MNIVLSLSCFEMDDLLIQALRDSNPWWDGRFFDVSIRPRETFKKIEPFMEKKQVIGVQGLRRTGKSYLAYHLISKLLKTHDARSLLYFSFDHFHKVELSAVLQATEELTSVRPRFIFLDEVQKLDDWADQVKRVYDLRYVKMFVTGSETLFLKKASKESLAGRIFEFDMQPLSFREYLSFKNIPTDSLHEPDVQKAVDHYLLTAGFPELVDVADPFFIRKYLKEGIIDKAIFREIPQRFNVDDPSLLDKLLNIVIDHPGLLVDKNDLAKSLGIFRTTVSKYLFYLETCFLLKSLHNYSANVSTSEKKLKKYYPAFIPLGLGLKNDSTYLGKVVETACVLKSGAKFFWRSPQHDEVDMVLTNPLRPVEVKYRNDLTFNDSLEKFQKKFHSESGFLITKNATEKQGGTEHIPFWKWLLKD